jgi:hypothetical protein
MLHSPPPHVLSLKLKFRCTSSLSVSVNVRFLYHGVDLLAAQLLAQVHHHHGQLLPVDVAVTILKREQ